MRINKILFSIVFFIFLVNSNVFSAVNADIFVSLSPETGLAPCGANNTLDSVHIVSKKNLTNLEITFSLPTGVNYVPGSVTAGVSEVNITNLNAPVFGVGNMVAFQVVDFEFLRTASCSAVQYAISGNQFKDEYSLSYLGGTESPLIDNDLLISPYDLDYASLVISAINTVSLNVGDQVTDRDVIVNQGGNGCIQNFTHFVVIDTSQISNYVFKFNGNPLVPNLMSTLDTLFYDIDLNQAIYNIIGNGNSCFDNGESINFTESFEINGCILEPIKHFAYWGCLSDEVCQEADSQSGALIFGTEVPNVSISGIGNSSIFSICDTNIITYEITNNNNNSGATALDVLINVGAGTNNVVPSTHSNTTLYGHSSIKPATNFKINGIPVTDTIWNALLSSSGTSQIALYNLLTSDPDGAGVGLEDIDNDGFYDDLGPGQSFQFSYEVVLNPNYNSGSCNMSGRTFINYEHMYTHVAFKTQCGNNRPGIKADLNYSYFGKNYAGAQSSIVSPTDITTLTPFTVSVRTQFNRNSFSCGTSNTETYQVRIPLPPGVSYDGVTPPNLVGSLNPLYYMDGDTLVYEISGGYNTANQNRIFDFPLVLDCAIYPSNVLNLTYVSRFICNTGCLNIDLECGVFSQINTHCPTSCNGPVTLGFSANRRTAGFTNSSMTTRVVLNPNIHNTKFYLSKDTMEIKTYAFVKDTVLDEMYFKFKYNSPVILDFVSGEILINDLSSGVYSSPLNLPPTITTIGTLQEFSFDLSNYRSIVNPNYSYGENLDSDTVWLNIKMIVPSNFGGLIDVPLNNFIGEFFLKDSLGDETSCDRYGEVADVHNPYVYATEWLNNTTFNECADNAWVRHGLYNRYLGQNSFPLEYRPGLSIDTVKFILPDYVDYESGSAFFTGGLTELNGGCFTQWNSSTRELSVWPSNIYSPPTFPSGLVHARIGLDVKCGAPERIGVGFDTTVIKWNQFAYAPSLELARNNVVNHSDIYQFNTPTYIFQTPTPVVQGTSSIVSWDIQITKTSNGAMPYNWLKIEEITGVNITDIQIVSSSTSVPFLSLNGSTYAEFGNVNSGTSNEVTIRIFASFTICTDVNFNVTHGWSCSGYSSNYDEIDSVNCYVNTLNLSLQILSSEIQLNVLNVSTPVDMCTPFNVELDLFSLGTGDVVNPYITLEAQVANSLSIINDSVSVEYPFSSGNIENVSVDLIGSTFQFNLMEHSQFNSVGGMNGIENNSSLNGRRARIVIPTQVECNFVANSVLSFRAFGNNPCTISSIGSGNEEISNIISLIGVSTDYEFFNSLSVSDSLLNCNTFDTIFLQSGVFSGSGGVTDVFAQGKVVLFEDLNYVSIGCTSTDCPTYNSTNLVSGRKEIIFDIPQGLPNGTILDYYIIVESGVKGCELNSSVDLITYTTVGGLFCDTSNCPFTLIETGNANDVWQIIKPDLNVSTAIDAEVVFNPGVNEYHIVQNVTNLDSILSMNTGYTYNVYCDNGLGGASGASIYNGVLTQAINPLDNFIDSISFLSTSICSVQNGLLIEFIPSISNCQCDTVYANISLIEIESIIAIEDIDSTEINASVDIYFLQNDTSFTSSFDSINITNTLSSDGVVLNNNNGSFTYSPNLNYFGFDTFTYTVCNLEFPSDCETVNVIILVLPPPIIAVDDTINLNQNESFVFPVSLNDTAMAGIDSASLDTLSSPFNGILNINSSGTFTYIPNNNYFGVDSFEYIICDDFIITTCDTAVVNLIINSVDSNEFISCDSLVLNTITYFTSQIDIDTFITVNVWDSIIINNIIIYNSIEITNPNLTVCDSAEVNSNWYSVSQIVRDTFATVNGCDSIEVTDVTINNSIEIINANVVSCDSVEVNSNWYATSQIVRDTFVSVNGCDSVELTDVTINSSIEITNANVIACDSVEVNSNWYTTSQIVRDTFVTVNGCDSVELTDVTINYSIEITNANVIVCDSAEINSNWYTTSQIVRDTFATVNGCDSIEVTDVIVNNSIEITNPSVIVCDSVEVNSNWYTTTQIVRDTFTAVNGCDSIIVTDVMINNSLVINNSNIVSCDSAEVNSNWYTSSQIVRDTFARVNGCDSIEVTDVTINNSIDITNTNVITCDSAEVNSNWYSTSQIVRDTFARVNGCDSIEVTDVTINNSIEITNANVIACDSTEVNSNWYSTSQIVRDTFARVNGCDSIELTDITINNSIEIANVDVIACDSAEVNSNWYYVSQIVRDTFATINGCDSIEITNITINNSIEITNSNIIACDSAEINSNWYFVSQIVRDTFATIYGCDSIEVSDVTINNSIEIINASVITCDSVEVNSNWYISSQIVRDTFARINGCDSIEVTDVTINSSIEITNTNVVACDSTEVNSNWYSTSQIVRDTFTRVNGCDSIEVTDITINNSIEIANANVIACDSTEINSNWYFVSQIVRDTFATINGCDSIEITDLVINNYSVVTNPNVVSCDSVLFQGIWYYSTQTIRDTLATVLNCDSVIITPLVINNSIEIVNANLVACDSVELNSNWYTSSQIVRDTFVTVSGCDSIEVTDVTINNSIEITNPNVIACDSAEVNSNWYTTSQIVRDTFATVNGCDSIEVTDVTINNSIEITNANVIACDSVEVNSNWYTISEIVKDTFVTVNGCDSIEITDVTINNSIEITNANIVACDSVEVNFNWYTSSQIVRDTFATINGCDSIEVTDVTVNYSIEITNANVIACDSIEVNSNWYTSSQIVRDTFATTNGCDSIEVTDVTINNSIETTNANLVACDSALFNGVWYSVSQNVRDTLMTIHGCDSVNVTPIVINNSIEITNANIVACDSVEVNFNWYTSSQIVRDTFATINGCDSIEVTDVTVNYSIEITNPNVVACDSSLINGNWYTTSQIVRDTFATVNGCDSIEVTDVTINSSIETTNANLVACDSALFNGVWYSISQNVRDTLMTIHGCDSVNVTPIVINNSIEITNANIVACDSVEVNSNWYTTSQIVRDTFTTVNGCDSIEITDVTVNYSIEITNANVIACDSIEVNSNWYTISQIVRDTFATINGCDSIEVTDVTINSSIETTNANLVACDSALFNGVWYSVSQNIRDTLMTIHGCDSVNVTPIVINNSIEITNANVIACDSAEVNSNWYTTSQIVRDTFATINGCDSIEITEVSINYSIEITNPNVVACDSSLINGNWYTTSQIVRDTFATVNGCDSIEVTGVTINYSIEISNPNIIACDSIEVNSNWYATSQIVRDTFATINGCDSIEITDITINYSIGIINPNVIACDSSLINGNWYTTPQIVRDTFLTVNGCDSIEVTDVTINYSIEVTNPNVIACDSFIVNGNWYFVSQIVRDTFNTVNGCDSIEITNLVVNNQSIVIKEPNDMIICPENSSFSLEFNFEAQNVSTYQWQIDTGFGFQNLNDILNFSGSSSADLIISVPFDNIENGALFRLQYTDDCGYFNLSNGYEVKFNEAEDFIGIGDVELCEHETNIVEVDYNGSLYVWNDSESTSGRFLEPAESGEYIVNFIQNSTTCQTSDTILITIEDCIDNCVVSFPTGFSPGISAGINDIFRVVTNCDEGFESFNFSVFNRWGERIYYTENPNEGWDGIYKNAKQELGIYTYSIEYVKAFSTKKEFLKGTFTLVR